MRTASRSSASIPGKEMPLVVAVVKNTNNTTMDSNNNNNNSMRKSSSSSNNLKKLISMVVHSKRLFKSKKPRTPVEVVRETRELLLYLDSGADAGKAKRDEKLEQLNTDIKELKSILYGRDESEPVQEACAQLTKEIFKDDTLRLLIFSLPNLNLEPRKHATQVVANLQRQPVNSRLIASDYLENNLDIMDKLITGYEDPVVALHFGVMLRECLRHQVVARYVMNSEHMKKFFDYIQLPNFDVASNAADTFKELMTRHKSSVAEFMAENYTWFFADFNSKLLESTNYLTRRNAIKLLGDILLDRANAGVMIRYVSSKNNMRVLMNLLRESHKSLATLRYGTVASATVAIQNYGDNTSTSIQNSGALGNLHTGTQTADAPDDMADAMSKFLEDPAMNGLLSGVAQQTGVGSPDMFRNMLQQFTQNPAMRNTVNQIAQQLDSNGLEDMMAGLGGGGEGGCMDLSRMMQQMMPMVAQALGGGVSSAPPQITGPMENVLSGGSRSRREAERVNNDPQMDLGQVLERIENQSSSQEIFQSVGENVVHFLGNDRVLESAVNDLCSEGGLAQEFMEMLRNDISSKFRGEMGS